MAKFGICAAIVALTLAGSAKAATTMPLNTGYNYSTFTPYGIPANAGSVPIRDQYWIKIASYEPPLAGTIVEPAYVLNQTLFGAPWFPVPPPERWIGAKATTVSATGVSLYNPGYSIFRKCFCLMQGYKNPSITFKVRADDRVQVWLNTVTSTLIGPVGGAWGSATGLNFPASSSNPNQFRTGRNCLYVLVEDLIGHTGFSLTGSVTADGLMPAAAAGANMSFEPCACPSAQPGTPGAANAAEISDRAIVQSLVRLAETRRIGAIRSKLRVPGVND